MACNKLIDTDWKKGTYNSVEIGNIKIPFNFFSCSTFFFDGLFYVVEFPVGMNFYHGELTNNEFPIGNKFYEPLNKFVPIPSDFINLVKSSDKSIEQILGKFNG